MIKKKTLLIFLLSAVALFSFAACGKTAFNPEELIAQGYHNVITLDFNGGATTASEKYIKLYLRDGAKISYEDIEKNKKAPLLNGYRIEGFARGTEKEDGTIEFDTDPSTGEIVYWDFENDTVSGKEVFTLYTVWVKRFNILVKSPEGTDSLVYYLPENDSDTAQIAAETLNNAINSPAGHTFIGEYYYDQALENQVTFPYTFEKVKGNETVIFYAGWVEGDFNIVRTEADFRNGIRNGVSMYLTTDLDFADAEGNPTALSIIANYSQEINGNGHTVSNFSISYVGKTGVNADYFGLFRQIGATAYIHDVTFESFTMTAENTGNPTFVSIGLFAGQIAAGARFDNVTVSGSLVYTLRAGFSGDRIGIGTICGNQSAFKNNELAGITINGTVEAAPQE